MITKIGSGGTGKVAGASGQTMILGGKDGAVADGVTTGTLTASLKSGEQVASGLVVAPAPTTTMTLKTECGAVADGLTTGTVTAILKEGDQLAVSRTVKFQINDGSALFSNESNGQTVVTGALGEATVTLTDKTAETVTILVTPDGGSTQQVVCEFVPAGSGYLPTPEIEGVHNDNIYLEELSDPVFIIVSSGSVFSDGDRVVLSISGEDASGVSVPDETLTHTVVGNGLTEVTFSLSLKILTQYGGKHDNEYGQLALSYSLNGAASPVHNYNVYGKGGNEGHNYTVSSEIVVNNAPADGKATNQIKWWVTDEDEAEVKDVAATATINGSAVLAGVSQVTLPATLNYTDTVAENVTASMVLVGGGASAQESLTFSTQGRYDFDFPVKHLEFYAIPYLDNYQFIAGRHYNISIDILTPDVALRQCFDGDTYDKNNMRCMPTTSTMVIRKLGSFIPNETGYYMSAYYLYANNPEATRATGVVRIELVE